MTRRAWIAPVAVLAALVVATGAWMVRSDSPSDASTGRDAFRPFSSARASGWTPVARQAPSSWTPAAAGLPRSEGSTGDFRVASGLAPPTNRWYSGMVLGAEPQPVFPLPLAVRADDSGVSVGLPRVAASDRLITAPFEPGLRVQWDADGFAATRADPVSVTATYTADGASVGRLTLAEGWPYAGYTALRDQEVGVPGGLVRRDGGRWLALESGDTTYGLAVARADGSRRPLTPADGGIEVRRGESVLVFASRRATALAALARGAVPVRDTAISHDLAGDEARTRIAYRTAGGRDTVLAAMPHHRLDRPDVVARMDSLYGPVRLLRSRTLVSSVPALEPDATLALARLDRRARAELREQVVTDVAEEVAGPAPRQDTYFGGKDVYRMAQLTRLAEAVGAVDAGETMRERVVSELDAWLGDATECTPSSTRCFSYDTAWKGVVGRTAAFGSEQFNDHHFHYGYFLAAAALVGEGRPALLDRWRPTLTALAEDIASPVGNATLPALRTFDPYTGHSWAAGTSDFADGNNQESTSEAVNAWNGLALWARADDDAALERQATWQLSLEVAAARAYWLQPRHLPRGYGHPFVSLNWGGKREWATWFSAEPSAILGIQLLPMPAVLAQGRVDAERVRANVADASPEGFDVVFGDYLTMYLALADPRRALEIGRRLPDSAIDDGNSRSQLLAWLLTARAGALGVRGP